MKKLLTPPFPLISFYNSPFLLVRLTLLSKSKSKSSGVLLVSNCAFGGFDVYDWDGFI